MLHPAPRRPLTDLHATPNWYGSVMGTGILATCAAGLPVHVPGLRAAGTALWLVAAGLLVVLLVATVAHGVRHPAAARSHHLDPVMAHFYGAPPMAVMTVGAGTLTLGPAILGPHAALVVGAALWTVGTLLGLASAVVVPVLQFTRHASDEHGPFAGWLMPVVPPMVSATTGALLLPHVPAGQARLTFALALGAMFGVSLVATVAILPLVWGRLARGQVGPAALVPTLWIALGPLGQSATAALALGGEGGLVVPQPWDRALDVAGVLYAVPVLGFAGLWALVAGAVTARTARSGLPFGLAWWAFTFPVGTCVAGLSALAARTGAVAVTVLAVAAFVGLVGAWGVVAARTWHATLVTRTLLVPAHAR